MAAPVDIALSPPRPSGARSLEEALAQRRSVRHFAAEPLLLWQMVQVLWAGQGITAENRFRTTPSAGATYPLELVVVAGQLAGCDAAVYRYRPLGHALRLVRLGDIRADLAAAAYDQGWLATAPASIVITAIQLRTTRRYGARGPRYVGYEAGMAAQAICLQATALELGSCVVGAFSDRTVKLLLDLESEEQPHLIIGLGWPSAG